APYPRLRTSQRRVSPLSAIRARSTAASASARCSFGERSPRMASASQPPRRRRSTASASRPARVSAISTRRRSPGSGARETRPAGRRPATVLAIDRLVFLISVPVGLFGTVWAYLKLEERSTPRRASIDWWGNVTFALGLVLLMVSVPYGFGRAGGSSTRWTSPRVIVLLSGAAISFIVFAIAEQRVAEPMFRLPLFRIRAFTFGTLSTFLSAVARGGLMFMLIIWL